MHGLHGYKTKQYKTTTLGTFTICDAFASFRSASNSFMKLYHWLVRPQFVFPELLGRPSVLQTAVQFPGTNDLEVFHVMTVSVEMGCLGIIIRCLNPGQTLEILLVKCAPSLTNINDSLATLAKPHICMYHICPLHSVRVTCTTSHWHP